MALFSILTNSCAILKDTFGRNRFSHVRFIMKDKTDQEIQGSVMIIGGGIGGMQAALDLADSGFYVHLVEQSPAIGGAMSQLDKTFPTNDCAM